MRSCGRGLVRGVDCERAIKNLPDPPCPLSSSDIPIFLDSSNVTATLTSFFNLGTAFRVRWAISHKSFFKMRQLGKTRAKLMYKTAYVAPATCFNFILASVH